MRLTSVFFGRRVRRCVSRQASVATLIVLSCLAILLVPRSSNSHEPITTKVMFNKEIVRIFQRSCLACHNTGSITNISLATYAQARPWAKAFKEEVLEKRMPPFQAVKGFGHFRNDYTLTQREVDLIVSWVEGGAPKGDDKDLPPELMGLPAWTLGQPDLILQPEREVRISSEGKDEYRCLTLPTNLGEDRWLTAVDFHPGNGAAVHSASFAIDQTAKSQLLASDQHAVDCGPKGVAAVDSLGTWVPGQAVTRLPENVARLLPARSRIVMRIHYHKTGEAESDQSSLALYFAKGRETRPLRAIALAPPETEIPAGAERQRIKVSYTMPKAAEAIAIRPLLFPFAKSVEATAYRPDGTAEILIWAKDYRYDWQPRYNFKNPVMLPLGTRIEVTAYLDNSDNNPNNPNSPPRAIRFASALCELLFVNAGETK